MEFTPRTKQILNALLQENQTMSVKVLADKVGVSRRTVQRELEYINGSLKDYEISFMSRTGVGVWLEGSEEEKKSVCFWLLPKVILMMSVIRRNGESVWFWRF